MMDWVVQKVKNIHRPQINRVYLRSIGRDEVEGRAGFDFEVVRPDCHFTFRKLIFTQYSQFSVPYGPTALLKTFDSNHVDASIASTANEGVGVLYETPNAVILASLPCLCVCLER